MQVSPRGHGVKQLVFNIKKITNLFFSPPIRASIDPVETATCVVLAHRDDLLGGWLNTIFNAKVIAHALNIPFRFVWPKVGFYPEMNKVTDFFEQAFIDEYMITEAQASEIMKREKFAPQFMTTQDAIAHVRSSQSPMFIDSGNALSAFKFSDESHEAAANRFKELNQSNRFGTNVSKVIRQVSRCVLPDNLTAIHIRMGDHVWGQHDQLVPHQKYLNRIILEDLLEKSDSQVKKFVVFSANIELVRDLKKQFPNVKAPSDFLPKYKSFDSASRDFADIFLMMRCCAIIGPRRSQFSRLAANLANIPMKNLDYSVPRNERVQCLNKSAVGGLRTPKNTLDARIRARDICNLLDQCRNTVPIKIQKVVAKQATNFDPKFAGAFSRLSAVGAALGQWENAVLAADHAVDLVKSQPDPLLPDPLAEAFGFKTIVYAKQLATTKDAALVQPRLEHIGSLLQTLKELPKPYWVFPDDTVSIIEFIVRIASLLVRQRQMGTEPSEQKARPVSVRDIDHLWLKSRIPDGQDEMSPYPLLGFATSSAIALSGDLAQAIKVPESQASLRADITQIRNSRGGIRWLTGKCHFEGDAPLLAVLTCNGRGISTAPMSCSNESLADKSQTLQFSIPIPSDPSTYGDPSDFKIFALCSVWTFLDVDLSKVLA